jgi:hypothetical protein
MRRVFKTRSFNRWLRKTELTNSTLCKAIAEMELGLVDADLGGGVIKKRVPLPGRGKSGGARTLLATNRADRWFYMFGFEKNELANISAQELQALRMLSGDLLSLSAASLDTWVKSATLQEICNEDQN